MPQSNIPTHVVVGFGCSASVLVHELLRWSNVIVIVDGDDLTRCDVHADQPIGSEAHKCSDCAARQHAIQWPNAFLKYAGKSKPQDHLFSRSIPVVDCRGIGGNAAVNAMIFSLGHSYVFEQKWPSPWKPSDGLLLR